MVSEMEFSEDPVSDRETREPPDVDEHRAHPVGQPCSVVSVSGDLPSAPCMLSSPALWGDSVSHPILFKRNEKMPLPVFWKTDPSRLGCLGESKGQYGFHLVFGRDHVSLW